MRRGPGWSERLKAPRTVSHQGARFQMGTERIQDGSPSFRIKLRISIIQLVPVGRNWANQSKGGDGCRGEERGNRVVLGFPTREMRGPHFSSLSGSYMWGRVTEFWPRKCRLQPFPGLAHKHLLRVPPSPHHSFFFPLCWLDAGTQWKLGLPGMASHEMEGARMPEAAWISPSFPPSLHQLEFEEMTQKLLAGLRV